MNNYLKNIKIRNIIILFLAFIFIVLSIYFYRDNKSKVFMDEYMEDIFVEESVSTISEDYNALNDLSIEKESKNTIVVEIKGEVKNPDVYEMEEGSIIKDLIEKAGGLTSEANIDKINRAAKLNPNQLIIIPNKNSSEENFLGESEIIYGETNESSEKLININTASLEELTKINGIGETKAKSIIEYREKNGAFKSIEEIKNVKGIGEKTFEKLKDSITI
ncbi:helix-hairpin-helix domain-containing protein [Clostridium isatidis]|uniref:Competence protein ComEA n=1 Tax=Clostridium isatidis TaxID=182773 RepID=A0A343JEM8_9CLOT|nr:helix-hairpin-helix domain-containing protein [Clostridium isatidis]ASW43986.1 competence protein ComEA [Clostridium isatidis]NLZ35642.1 competence protein ComEA [Clostridiales bacterium]